MADTTVTLRVITNVTIALTVDMGFSTVEEPFQVKLPPLTWAQVRDKQQNTKASCVFVVGCAPKKMKMFKGTFTGWDFKAVSLTACHAVAAWNPEYHTLETFQEVPLAFDRKAFYVRLAMKNGGDPIDVVVTKLFRGKIDSGYQLEYGMADECWKKLIKAITTSQRWFITGGLATTNEFNMIARFRNYNDHRVRKILTKVKMMNNNDAGMGTVACVDRVAMAPQLNDQSNLVISFPTRSVSSNTCAEPARNTSKSASSDTHVEPARDIVIPHASQSHLDTNENTRWDQRETPTRNSVQSPVSNKRRIDSGQPSTSQPARDSVSRNGSKKRRNGSVPPPASKKRRTDSAPGRTDSAEQTAGQIEPTGLKDWLTMCADAADADDTSHLSKLLFLPRCQLIRDPDGVQWSEPADLTECEDKMTIALKFIQDARNHARPNIPPDASLTDVEFEKGIRWMKARHRGEKKRRCAPNRSQFRAFIKQKVGDWEFMIYLLKHGEAQLTQAFLAVQRAKAKNAFQRQGVPTRRSHPTLFARARLARRQFRWGQSLADAVDSGKRKWDDFSPAEQRQHEGFHNGTLEKKMVEANIACGHGEGAQELSSAATLAAMDLSAGKSYLGLLQ